MPLEPLRQPWMVWLCPLADWSAVLGVLLGADVLGLCVLGF